MGTVRRAMGVVRTKMKSPRLRESPNSCLKNNYLKRDWNVHQVCLNIRNKQKVLVQTTMSLKSFHGVLFAMTMHLSGVKAVMMISTAGAVSKSFMMAKIQENINQSLSLNDEQFCDKSYF